MFRVPFPAVRAGRHHLDGLTELQSGSCGVMDLDYRRIRGKGGVVCVGKTVWDLLALGGAGGAPGCRGSC